MLDGMQPTDVDCWRCQTPLPFDPTPFLALCPPPPQGSIFVTGALCSKCGAESAYRIAGELVVRCAPQVEKGAPPAKPS